MTTSDCEGTARTSVKTKLEEYLRAFTLFYSVKQITCPQYLMVTSRDSDDFNQHFSKGKFSIRTFPRS